MIPYDDDMVFSRFAAGPSWEVSLGPELRRRGGTDFVGIEDTLREWLWATTGDDLTTLRIDRDDPVGEWGGHVAMTHQLMLENVRGGGYTPIWCGYLRNRFLPAHAGELDGSYFIHEDTDLAGYSLLPRDIIRMAVRNKDQQLQKAVTKYCAGWQRAYSLLWQAGNCEVDLGDIHTHNEFDARTARRAIMALVYDGGVTHSIDVGRTLRENILSPLRAPDNPIRLNLIEELERLRAMPRYLPSANAWYRLLLASPVPVSNRSANALRLPMP